MSSPKVKVLVRGKAGPGALQNLKIRVQGLGCMANLGEQRRWERVVVLSVFLSNPLPLYHETFSNPSNILEVNSDFLGVRL